MERLNNTDIALIEAYIDRELTEEQQIIFQDRMDNCEAFRREVILQETVVKSIYKEKRNALKKELKNWADQPEVKKRAKKQRKTPVIRMCIGVAASILAAVSLFFMQNEHSGAHLYAGHYVNYPSQAVVRGEANVTYETALNYYAIDEFSEAEKAFETLLAAEDNSRYHLYLANCYMKNEKWDKAEQSLLKVVNSGAELVHEAKWFLSLVYIKKNDLKKSKHLLKEVKADHKIYSSSASDLLKEMN